MYMEAAEYLGKMPKFEEGDGTGGNLNVEEEI